MARIKPQALLLQSKKKKGPTRISITTIIFCNLVVVLVVFSLFATYRHWSNRFVIVLLIWYLVLCLFSFSMSKINAMFDSQGEENRNENYKERKR